MKLWTLLDENVYRSLKEGKEYFPKKPSQLLASTYEWFIHKTGLNHWPVWCWMTTPTIDKIQKYCDKIHHNENKNSFLLELNIPNNERMVFIPDSAWDFIANYQFLDNEKMISEFNKHCLEKGVNYYKSAPCSDMNIHNAIQSSWIKAFDLKWCEDNFKEFLMRVCIRSLHPHWIETTYVLTPKVIEEAEKNAYFEIGQLQPENNNIYNHVFQKRPFEYEHYDYLDNFDNQVRKSNSNKSQIKQIINH